MFVHDQRASAIDKDLYAKNLVFDAIQILQTLEDCKLLR